MNEFDPLTTYGKMINTTNPQLHSQDEHSVLVSPHPSLTEIHCSIVGLRLPKCPHQKRLRLNKGE